MACSSMKLRSRRAVRIAASLIKLADQPLKIQGSAAPRLHRDLFAQGATAGMHSEDGFSAATVRQFHQDLAVDQVQQGCRAHRLGWWPPT